MTTPDNPGQTEPDGPRAADPDADLTPEVTTQPPAVPHVADQPSGAPEVTDKAPVGLDATDEPPAAPGEGEATAAADTPVGSADTPEMRKKSSPDVSPPDTARDDALQQGAPTGGSPQDRRPPDKTPDNQRGSGSTNGTAAAVTSGVPSWERTEAAASGAGPATTGFPVGQPEHPRGATQPQAGTRPAGNPYGHSPNFGPASQPPSRYGRPVAQPFNTQSSRGPSSNFSQPTVRIGGRVQSEPASHQPSSARVRPTRIPRRASLQLRYLEPWSVLKVSLVLSVAGFLAWMVAVGVLYSILGGMGVWDQLNGTYSDLTSVSDPQASEDLISAGGVFGVAALVGLVNIVLITAMCTVGAFIYNAS
ncbi:MAG: DUF3566 domain-containing protein, partial [Pseudonocardiaceae bacterium]